MSECTCPCPTCGTSDPVNEPLGYVFTDTETMQPPTSQRFPTRVQAAVARDVWEARYGFNGRFVVCALVPALDLIDKHAREGQQ